ncbi:1,3-beta-glucanosyltransferase GAS1 SCDLUD_004420 [Saccharomycodes ludwigii]|uniref:1,3-beta-glucanosyltransferase GAS1 n=1 Tax=Saccharomycodes ludwigii TaxID=36035 RepID=UPI001E881D56|nr:hypothetical protein SCDLUD_004420 [Saccharomycodes ludwigii]KAH3898999.1 hypothetical protein SCDLUD_004420 [Saccharomycodes ludwigii]
MFFNTKIAFGLASLFAGYVTAGNDLPSIEIEGNKFFYSNNGSQFYIKGVAYQANSANATAGETIVDPLADYDSCSRDIPYLEKLTTNVIRVYAVNTSLDHSKCMSALNDAGIYVIADLSDPTYAINRESPAWTVDLYDRYTSVIDEFANYTNVLGFFAGNEVTNNSTNTDASTFVKAAVRDSKAYIKKQGYRSIPVGYSSNDDADTRVAMADYFACGDDDDKADFYGINMYEWCGPSTYATSGYKDRTAEFANLSIPLFFSEYGCNSVQPRKFTEVQALYGSNMTSVWSGGIVYMYFQEENDYGLVSIVSSSVSTLSDFNYLSSELHSISPSSVNNASYTASSTSLSCPATGVYWEANTKLPPTPNSDLCSCMEASLSCVYVNDTSDDTGDAYDELFSYICAEIDCADIIANGTTGKYGSYSFCSPAEKLSYVMNVYYKKYGSSSDCDFSGSATLQSATTASTCSSMLKAVSLDSASGSASGSASASASASDSSSGSQSSSKASSKSSAKSGSSDSSSSSGSSSSSTSTSKSKSAASASVKVNLFQVILSSIVTLAAVAGVGFVLA